jgi:hypothetical protein
MRNDRLASVTIRQMRDELGVQRHPLEFLARFRRECRHGLMRGDYGSRLRQSCLLRAMEKEQNQNGQNNGDYDRAVLSSAVMRAHRLPAASSFRN